MRLLWNPGMLRPSLLCQRKLSHLHPLTVSTWPLLGRLEMEGERSHLPASVLMALLAIGGRFGSPVLRGAMKTGPPPSDSPPRCSQQVKGKQLFLPPF